MLIRVDINMSPACQTVQSRFKNISGGFGFFAYQSKLPQDALNRVE
jgi:hypothetical protein